MATVIVASFAIAAILAVPAMAESGYAKWSPGYPVKVAGSVTFERSDGAVAPVTCTVEETFSATNRPWYWHCPGRVIGGYEVTPIWTQTNPLNLTFYLMGQASGTFEGNPWSSAKWYSGGLLPEFQNGDAKKTSRVTFSKQAMGFTYTAGGAMTNVFATGTVYFTSSTGGLTVLTK
ncbi:MAG TPA: hypothetical protein VJU14_07800 [Solirubrobacterales bacterium]|nr:hypothetical protein [Solirubrobacterales bacterium]